MANAKTRKADASELPYMRLKCNRWQSDMRGCWLYKQRTQARAEITNCTNLNTHLKNANTHKRSTTRGNTSRAWLRKVTNIFIHERSKRNVYGHCWELQINSVMLSSSLMAASRLGVRWLREKTRRARIFTLGRVCPVWPCRINRNKNCYKIELRASWTAWRMVWWGILNA